MTDIESWKQEPVSPDWFEIDDWADYNDTTIFEDLDLIIKEADINTYSTNYKWQKQAYMKYPPPYVPKPQFSSWPEQTCFEGGYTANSAAGNVSQHSSIEWAEESKTTPQLLQEFEDVLTRALTPPDSPEQQGISPPHQTQPYYPPTLVHLQPPQPSLRQQEISSHSTESEIDAIVAESFNNGDYTSSSDSGYEDPDWAPITSKVRTRPYPSLEERKARKKEQNKNAATRYRQKKKQEIEVILSEERELQEKNDTLKAEMEEICREKKYLKSLLRHIFRAKGMIA